MLTHHISDLTKWLTFNLRFNFFILIKFLLLFGTEFTVYSYFKSAHKTKIFETNRRKELTVVKNTRVFFFYMKNSEFGMVISAVNDF